MSIHNVMLTVFILNTIPIPTLSPFVRAVRQNSNYLLWYREMYFTALSYLYLCSHFHLCTCDALGFYSISSIQYISMKRTDDIQFNKKRYKSTNCKPVYLQKQNQSVTVVQVRKLLGENNNK